MRSRTIAAVVLGLLYAPVSGAQQVVHLSLKEAEDRAVQNHPQVRAGEYAALAAGERVRETRSAYFPTASLNFTGAQAQDGSAITAGGLNNPSVLGRFAYGFVASQMLTDFGRTPDLTASATLRVDAQQQDVVARRSQVMLDVDRAYFAALRARTVLRVAEETVSTRQTVLDQVTALATTGIKSTLDVSFAKVNLAEAQLLLVQSRNDVQAGDARLSTAMGSSQVVSYDLVDEPMPGPPPDDSPALIARALTERPDVARERFATESAMKFAEAERALSFPSLSLVGAGGLTPYHQVGLNDRYSAIGLNVTLPLSNGSLYAARHQEATFELSVQQQRLQDLENGVALDVRLAWLAAQTAFQRIALTDQLTAAAADAFDLAQQRYGLGLSSIVELTQAQLNQTQAQIEQASARYEYQERSATLRFAMGSLK